MAELQETVTHTRDRGINEQGAAVEQDTKKISTESSADSRTTASNVVWYIYGFIAIILALRFVLKLFSANSASGFVDFIYSLSGLFTAPFDNIFGVGTANAGETNAVFEPSILVAILVYGLIAWGIVKLLNIDQKQ